jgi:hypothetical protein
MFVPASVLRRGRWGDRYSCLADRAPDQWAAWLERSVSAIGSTKRTIRPRARMSAFGPKRYSASANYRQPPAARAALRVECDRWDPPMSANDQSGPGPSNMVV